MYVRKDTIQGFNSIKAFVKNKINLLENSGGLFCDLYELMFSEKDNILFEESHGFEIKKTSYGQAYDKVSTLSAALKTVLDLPAESVVGLYMDNGPEWIECLWAILRCGYRPLLLNARLSQETLEQTLKDMDARAVVSEKQLFTVKTILLSELQLQEAPAFKPEAFGSEILIMSSGTSRHIKVCAYSADKIRNQIKDSYRIILDCPQMRNHFDGELKQLALIPFYHVFGLTAVYFWFGFFSRTFVKLPSLTPAVVQEIIKTHKVTHIFAVPLFWNKVYDAAIKAINGQGEKTKAKFEKGIRIYKKLSGVPALQRLFSRCAMKQVREEMFGESVQFMISGGGAIKTEVLEFFNAIGYHMANGYGTTETGITSVELSMKGKALCSGGVGRPFASLSYKIDDKGMLLISGTSMATCIYSEGKKTELLGWHNTRDLVRKENESYYILGRNDDIIISSTGENINPNIYEPLFAVNGVRQLCLLNTKEDGIVILAERAISTSSNEEIKAMISERAEELKLIGEIKRVVITERPLILPEDFKLDRIAVCERYNAGEFFDAESGNNGDENIGTGQALVLEVKECFCNALSCEHKDISLNSNFFIDLGGDSLGYLGMIAELEEKYGVKFPSIGEKSLGTIEQIAAYIEEQR